MAWARANSNNKGAVAHATSVSITVNATTIGNLLVAIVGDYSATIPSSGVTDNKTGGSNTYTQDKVSSGYSARNYLGIHSTILSGSCTSVTYTPTSLDYIALIVCEYSGNASSSPQDGTGSIGNGSGTTGDANSFTPSYPAGSDLIVGGIALNTGGTVTPGGSFSEIAYASGVYNTEAVDLLNITSGAQDVTWTLGTSQGWSACSFAYTSPLAPYVWRPLTQDPNITNLTRLEIIGY